MTVPPYALATVGIAFGAWFAARTGRRAPLIIGSSSVAIIGTTPSSKVVLVRLTSAPCRLHRSSHDHNTYVVFMIDTKYPSSLVQNNLAGAQYAGVHFATLGVYTGNAVVLRFISHLLTPSIVLLTANLDPQLAGREYLWPNQACGRRSSTNYHRRSRCGHRSASLPPCLRGASLPQATYHSHRLSHALDRRC